MKCLQAVLISQPSRYVLLLCSQGFVVAAVSRGVVFDVS